MLATSVELGPTISGSAAKADPALLDLLPDDLREGVEQGRYLIQGPGQKRPVVIDAETGRFVKGSGRPLKANDAALVGRKTGWMRRRSTQEFFEQLLPAEREDSSHAVTSLRELMTQAAKLANGVPTKVECPKCEHTWMEPLRPDSKVLTFLIERAVGKAPETKDVNITGRIEQITAVLNDPTPLRTIEVVALSPEERAARKRAMAESDAAG